MEYIRKILGKAAKKALEHIIRIYGHPIATDRPTVYPKIPLKDDDLYWVLECPKCKGSMYAVYYTVNGVRYMCSLCGYKAG